MVPIAQLVFTGRMISRLMRRNKVTIEEIARQHSLTKKRVREVRTKGASKGFSSNEWHWLITGKWLEDLPAAELKRLADEARQMLLADLISSLTNQSHRQSRIPAGTRSQAQR
jgi:hypothetical protein